METTTQIRTLNDTFRQTLNNHLGLLVITSGVTALGSTAVATLVQSLRQFSDFTPDNDPYGEHDFGTLKLGAQRIFWKIDYYSDATCTWGSEAPHDPEQSYRVLTLMLAEEY
ncbi:MAG: DUF3768 domain-containing protein [Alphaproteobacteria bacterium]|nr:DUF3768 domain-containing protein [Alphaproteobacteria bacterium]MBO6629526.1 DUF3768 domain-containing protein [Alphaproteobacteria bacterium]MDF1625799.1 DUF3768 domain-containing protein [Parvibaculaceae bacterium]